MKRAPMEYVKVESRHLSEDFKNVCNESDKKRWMKRKFRRTASISRVQMM